MLSFHVNFVQTDRWTDRRTTVKQYAPDLSIWGHNKDMSKLKAFAKDKLSSAQREEHKKYLRKKHIAFSPTNFQINHEFSWENRK